MALSASMLVAAALAAVLEEDPAPARMVDDQALVLAARAIPTTTTLTETSVPTRVVIVSPGSIDGIALSPTEIELTEEAISRATTTTSSTTTTTVLIEQAPTTTVVAVERPGQPSVRKPAPPTTATTTAPSTTTSTQPPAPANQAGFRPGLESSFLSSINSLRADRGLPGLSANSSLRDYARAWAKTLAGQGGLKHSNIATLVPPWGAAAENVGKGRSVASVFELLRNSSGHLHNMVGNYTQIGIGVWDDGQGLIWTAHVFAR